jgi:hypothetical protein
LLKYAGAPTPPLQGRHSWWCNEENNISYLPRVAGQKDVKPMSPRTKVFLVTIFCATLISAIIANNYTIIYDGDEPYTLVYILIIALMLPFLGFAAMLDKLK